MNKTLKNKVSKLRLRLLLKPTNIINVYYKKGIFYGDFADVTEYKNIQMSHSNKFRESYDKKLETERRSDSLIRAKQNIYRIVHANAFKHGDFKPIFCTLTYKKEQTSLKEARLEFKYFIFKLNNFLEKKVQYICVPEIQKEREKTYGVGVWHFHMVLFNLPFVPIAKFKSLWSFGSVDLQVVEQINDVGAYLSKYLTKDTYDKRLYGQRAYNTSRGVIRPTHTFDDIQIDNWFDGDKVNLISSHESEFKKTTKWKKH